MAQGAVQINVDAPATAGTYATTATVSSNVSDPQPSNNSTTIIDTNCTICVSQEVTGSPVASEQALQRREELRAQHRRERAWYDRGARRGR